VAATPLYADEHGFDLPQKSAKDAKGASASRKRESDEGGMNADFEPLMDADER